MNVFQLKIYSCNKWQFQKPLISDRRDFNQKIFEGGLHDHAEGYRFINAVSGQVII